MCYYALLTLIKTNDIFLCKGILYLLLIPSPRTKAADVNVFATQGTEDLILNFFQSVSSPQGGIPKLT